MRAGAMLAAALFSTTLGAQGCERAVEQARMHNQWPAHLGALCAGEDPQWLAGITLGRDMDAGRIDDVFVLAHDLDAGIQVAGLSPARLAAIAQSLDLEKAETRTWLERLFEWLKSRFQRNAEDPRLEELLSALREWLPPAWLAAALFRATAVIIVVLALYLVLHELRGRPISPAQRQNTVPAGPRSDAAAIRSAPPDFEDILALPVAERAAALVRWLLESLAWHGCIPADSSRTNREYLAILDQERHELAAQFADALAQSEPWIYGKRVALAPELEAFAGAVRRIEQQAAGA